MDSNYTKAGYLTEPFKIFHLRDEHKLNIDFHYHDFHKILIHLHGNVSYCIEGRSYELKEHDIVLVNAGEVHCRIMLRNRKVKAGLTPAVNQAVPNLT